MEKDAREIMEEIEEEAPQAQRGSEDCADNSEEDCSFVAQGDLVVKDMPELKVLEHLKNETGAMDIGKTIKDLFTSMQNMDAQLNSVLSINVALENDIKASKDVIARLKSENLELEDTISALRQEMPSKRELQAEIQQLIEERNEAQASIRSMRQSVDKTKSETKGLRDRIAELESEKTDLQRDIHYLEIKLGAAIEKLNAYAKEIATLRGERVSLMEKFDKQSQQLKQCIEDKKRLQAYNLNI